ncbi:MAG: hypothetical protein IJD30_01005 [Clostridia bacterium]|nr:hypothetical protein [Clostridia bacterium]
MSILEKIYLQQLDLYHKKSEAMEEYILYTLAREEFCSKLSDELLAEFEKLMDLKLDCEDAEGLSLFKGGICCGINMAMLMQETK